ncbi:MAG: type II toxin-antitoxin system VapC family toxin [Alkalispirochaetaceae bacterium]
MKALLDTHALLWMVSSSERLSETARSTIADEANELYCSIAGYWEIGIKQSLGKLELAAGWEETLPREMTRNRIARLPVEPKHVHELVGLPWIHRDPFDRLMIAQALVEGLSVISRDRDLGAYGVPVVW